MFQHYLCPDSNYGAAIKGYQTPGTYGNLWGGGGGGGEREREREGFQKMGDSGPIICFLLRRICGAVF